MISRRWPRLFFVASVALLVVSISYVSTAANVVPESHADDISLPVVIPPTEVIAIIDIDPDHLNGDSHGNFVTVYIELPAGCAVSDIDVSSVRMHVQGETAEILALAEPTEVGDHDHDGTPDRMVKFQRSAVVELLGERDDGLVTLVVSGAAGWCTFEGSDVIFLDAPDDGGGDGEGGGDNCDDGDNGEGNQQHDCDDGDDDDDCDDEGHRGNGEHHDDDCDDDDDDCDDSHDHSGEGDRHGDDCDDDDDGHHGGDHD